MKVPIIDLKAQYEGIRFEILQAVESVLNEQQFIFGPEVGAFEREFAEYCGVKHTVSCGNGTDAILLALMALDIGPGDEVITTPFSFFGTVSPVVRLGACPVFVDIDPRTFNISAEDIRDKITGKTKAIIPVHLYGQTADMKRILEIADEACVPVIEDAAQAVGSRYSGAMAGSLGKLATFSFYPSKNLGAMGDGGMVTTDDANLADRLRILRSHGESGKYLHSEFCPNSRLDALQAAILRVKLRHLEEWTRKRREAAERYDKLLEENGLSPHKITLPYRLEESSPDTRHTFYQYTIRCRNRDALRDHLAKREIGSGVHYPHVLYRQPAFGGYSLKDTVCPEAERACAEVLSLPMYPELGAEQQEYVVSAIAEFYS